MDHMQIETMDGSLHGSLMGYQREPSVVYIDQVGLLLDMIHIRISSDYSNYIP